MRVLLVEASLEGHGLPQLKALSHKMAEQGHVVVTYIPTEIGGGQFDTVVSRKVPNGRFLRDNPSAYISWICGIEAVIERFDIDVVHFLTADYLYPYFGLLLERVGKDAILVGTFHLYRHHFLRRVAVKKVLPKLDIALTYSQSLRRTLAEISGVIPIFVDCPMWEDASCEDKETERAKWAIPSDAPLIVYLGSTRYVKGLDLLLEALQKVVCPFRLLVAGSESHIAADVIADLTEAYRDKVTTHLVYCTESEFISAAQAADIIVLPYRKSHTGGSGPLSIGVALGKIVVGPAHGTIGPLIKENHLGFTFESESVKDLTLSLEKALTGVFKVDDTYVDFQRRITSGRCAERYLELYSEAILNRSTATEEKDI